MSTFGMRSAANFINISVEDIYKSDIDALTDAFRYLRNLCVTKPSAQNEIIHVVSIENTRHILLTIVTCESANEDLVLCLQIGLQFLGNLIVNNIYNQQCIWTICQDLLEVCLKMETNYKVQNCAAMIIHNVFLKNPEFIYDISDAYEELYDLTKSEISDIFAISILERFVLKSDYIYKYYEDLKPKNKLIMLDVIRDLVNGKSKDLIPGDIISFFSEQFINKSDIILQTCDNYMKSLDPVEVVKILDILVAFSSDDKKYYLEVVQKETSLLINCIELLRSMHSLSKEKGNSFSMLSKIADFARLEKTTPVKEHPAFGMKSSLIRLIGNFCWKNPENQDTVRDLNCIPVLLDCCNIDARNPLILQWCILAIRNLCELNTENQKYIASMSKEGVIDSGRLRDLGITLTVDEKGEPLCMAPLK